MNRMAVNIRRMWHNSKRRGVAAVEFAMSMPIWASFLLGIADGSYCLLVNEKCDRIAYSVTDIVSQYQTITMANLTDIFLAAGQMMQPFSFSGTPGNGRVIVTSIYQDPTTHKDIIEWQRANDSGSSAASGSRIGSQGGLAVLPNGITLNDGDNVIVSEVFYNFTPLFLSSHLFSNSAIYRTAIYKPRLSPLVTPPT